MEIFVKEEMGMEEFIEEARGASVCMHKWGKRDRYTSVKRCLKCGMGI